MSETTEMEVRQPQSPAVQYRSRVETMSADFIRTMLGSEAAKEAAGRVALAFRAAAIKEPKLYAIPVEQVARSIALCAMTGLMPAGPLAEVELIPRGGNLDWQVTARGWRKLAERAGWRLDAIPVFTGDLFRAPRGLHADIVHEPDYDHEPSYERLRLYYITAERAGEKPRFKVITKSQIEDRRKKAQTQSVWKDWPLEMAEKTAISYAVRRGIVPLDPVGMAAAEDAEDATENQGQSDASRAHVIQAEQQAPALPTRGLAGLAAAIGDDPAPAKTSSSLPPPSPKSGGVSPESASTGAGPAGATARGSGPAAGPSKADREQAQDDAVRTAALMTTTRAPGSRVPLDHVRVALRTAKSIAKVSDLRFERAILAGVSRELWSLDGGDVVLPGPDLGANEPDSVELNVEQPDRWDALAGTELVDTIGSLTVRVGEHGTQHAMDELGLTEEQVAGDASEDQLRELGRLLDRAETELRAEVARHGEE